MIRDPEMLRWRDGLAPGHARADGVLTVGGVAVTELAQIYGTPLLVLDYEVLDAAIAAFHAACAPHGIDVSYAAKALLLTALARHLKHAAIDLEVCSLGEIAVAEGAGFPAQRLLLHGCGKSDEELAAAIEGRVGRIVVDNLDELDRLAARTRAGSIDVLLRLNTEITARTHTAVQTTGEATKFGFDDRSLPLAAARVRELPSLRFVGLHAHVGSQVYQREVFVANARVLMEHAAQLHGLGIPCETVIVGGGFGVQMDPLGPIRLDVAGTVSAIARAIREVAERDALPLPRIGIEPGRALVAHAGTSLYRVVAVKQPFGKRFAIVDGSLADNPRPALYGAYHHIVAASRESSGGAETIVCGRSCENDRLGVTELPADLRTGELVAVCTTGAYTYSMASNYNRFVRPPVVAVRDGTHALIARRETVDDLVRTELDV